MVGNVLDNREIINVELVNYEKPKNIIKMEDNDNDYRMEIEEIESN